MGDTDASETGATPAEPATPAVEPAAPAGPVQLPSDHPLVKAYEATKAELKAVRDAEKTDLQRAQDDLAAEKGRGDGLATKVAQLEAALKHQLDPEDIDLLGTGTPEEIEARAKRLADRTGPKKRNAVPKEGSNGTPKPDDERTFVSDLFGHG